MVQSSAGFLAGTGGTVRDLARRCPSDFRIDRIHQGDGGIVVGLGRDNPTGRLRRSAPRSIGPGPSGAVTLVNGEIYNLASLAQELGLDRTMPLTPVRLVDALLDRWGVDGLARLDGDYTLVRWSPADRALLLAACPMGRDSLCHAATPDGIVAASRPSWLLAVPDVDPEPDPEVLAYRLVNMESRIGDRTPWRHIRRLQPGWYLEWRDGSTRTAPFWSPVPRRTLRLRRDAEYVEAAREHLDRAVAARCPAGKPILCLLSAGLDSPGVAATASRSHDAPVHTLTIRADPDVPQLPPDAGHFADEWERLQPFLARYPGLRPHLVDAWQPDLSMEYAGGPLQSRDWPVKRPYQVSWMLLPLERTVREQDIGVVLSGDAGNVTLSYTGGRVVADQFRRGRALAAWRNLVPYRPELRGRPRLFWGPRALWGQAVAPLVGPGIRRLTRRLRGGRDYWWQEWSSIRPEVAERLRLAEHDQPTVRTGSPDLDNHIQLLEYFRQNNAQYAHLFQGMAWSWRDPYCDLGLVEFCLSLPRDQFRRNGVPRLLARRTLADRAPQPILDERRIGLQHADWFGWMGRRRDWMAAEIDRIEQSPLACSILDTQHMRAILDAWPATPEEAGRFPTSHRLRKGLGEALRVGQFILMQEGRNG
jgi:asparagine synthase (glutamine-hydrolysing)